MTGLGRWIAAALTGVAALAAGPAQAEWQQATSRHFIVYADDSEAGVRALADRLERFDAVMRRLHKVAEEPGTAANRVTVYVVGDQSDIAQIFGKGGGSIGGFYLPRATGSVAFTPKRIDWGVAKSQNIVLFHEYAHHFLLGNYAAAYPAWFSEGYAEFVSTTSFDGDAAIVGRPAQHRAAGLFGNYHLPVTTMFSPAGRKLSAEQTELLYGRGWLLTHLCLLDPARRTQFASYLRLVNTGKPSLDAAREAFGDLGKLDRDLNGYMQGSLQAFRLPSAPVASGDIAIAPLTPGARAMIDFRMASERGVGREAAIRLLARARPVAARFPTDAVAQGWLAEMAFDARQLDEAEAAADRAIAADPTSRQALLYKARVRLERASAAKEAGAAAWKEARSWIVRANRLNPDEAAPLVLFYDSFRTEGGTPPAAAVAGINRAMELVPQDTGLRLTVAHQALVDGRADLARVALRPIAYNPHAPADNPAMALLQILDKGDTKAALAKMDEKPAGDDKTGTD